VIKWRVYYDDGSTFDSSQGSPWTIPEHRGVQVVCYHTEDQDHSTGNVPQFGKDYYWYESETEEWFGGDIFGLFDYLARPGLKSVLFGRTIATARHMAIRLRACDDKDLMRKPHGSPSC
jgi:hypothetical protein